MEFLRFQVWDCWGLEKVTSCFFWPDDSFFVVFKCDDYNIVFFSNYGFWSFLTCILFLVSDSGCADKALIEETEEELYVR